MTGAAIAASVFKYIFLFQRKDDGYMEQETSKLVSLGIVLIAIAVVITLGFGIFAVGKRLANQGQNDLVAQVDQINQSTFTDLDQQVITGTRLKGVINQLSTSNYAVLLNTLALRNNTIEGTALTGDLSSSISNYQFVATNYPSTSSKGNAHSSASASEGYTLFVNYNGLLKNAAVTTDNKQIDIELSDDAAECDGTDKGMKLMMKDGVFTTELEFQTDNTGAVLKNNRIADFNKQGTTMYIADGAQFNSFCIKDSTDNYVGLAFTQIQK